MDRNITINALASRVTDGKSGAVLSASARDGCIIADMVEGEGTVRVSRDQRIVRVRFGDDGGIAEVAVDDIPVWTGS